MINVELLSNIDYIKCLDCNGKDESKLLKKLLKIEVLVKIATILLSTWQNHLKTIILKDKLAPETLILLFLLQN